MQIHGLVSGLLQDPSKLDMVSPSVQPGAFAVIAAGRTRELQQWPAGSACCMRYTRVSGLFNSSCVALAGHQQGVWPL
jgi:hypothetical protein